MDEDVLQVPSQFQYRLIQHDQIFPQSVQVQLDAPQIQ
jgi:hypothetical protein